jgi:hypothetical protein
MEPIIEGRSPQGSKSLPGRAFALMFSLTYVHKGIAP